MKEIGDSGANVEAEYKGEGQAPGRSRRRLAAGTILIAAFLVGALVIWPHAPSGTNPLDFTLPEATINPIGQPWHLADHLGRGKPVLLEFMSPIPGTNAVQRMVPVLRDLQNGTYGSKIVMVSVAVFIPDLSVTLTLETVASYAHDSNSTWTYLAETNGTHVVRDLYGVRGVPTFVLLKSDGSVAWSEVGITELATLETAVRQAI